MEKISHSQPTPRSLAPSCQHPSAPPTMWPRTTRSSPRWHWSQAVNRRAVRTNQDPALTNQNVKWIRCLSEDGGRSSVCPRQPHVCGQDWSGWRWSRGYFRDRCATLTTKCPCFWPAYNSDVYICIYCIYVYIYVLYIYAYIWLDPTDLYPQPILPLPVTPPSSSFTWQTSLNTSRKQHEI